MAPELRSFIDRVIVPALLERFRAEQSAASSTTSNSAAVSVREVRA